jgi:hypothetical protein
LSPVGNLWRVNLVSIYARLAKVRNCLAKERRDWGITVITSKCSANRKPSAPNTSICCLLVAARAYQSNLVPAGAFA